tara:strand:- start:177 stop:311 length:135 start_codon:yes stop_codon:yes gene_type:complete
MGTLINLFIQLLVTCENPYYRKISLGENLQHGKNRTFLAYFFIG